MPLRINFQRLRHSNLSVKARKYLSQYLLGGNSYPFVFHKAQGNPGRLSSNVYVHIPFCRTICPHCPYNKMSFNQKLYEQYKEALLKEIDLYINLLSDEYQLGSLYFGGGSPSMTPDLVCLVVEKFRSFFSKDVEIGVEVHPLDASEEIFYSLKQKGVNKISLGIETFNKELLLKLGRYYSTEEALLSIKRAKSIGFDCVDVNLIYGIPGQELEDSRTDIQTCVELKVDHISAYPLMTFIHTPMGKNVAGERWEHFDDLKRIMIQKEIGRICLENNYKRTSVWSFTINDKRPYTTVTRENYVGFGAGAGTKANGVFQFNTFSIPEYIKIGYSRPAIIMECNERFRRFHWLYWQIYNTSIDENEYKLLFENDIKKDFGFILYFMCLLGWIKKFKNKWHLTEQGAIWGHRLQMLFSLTYIDKVWKECQKNAWPEKIVLE